MGKFEFKTKPFKHQKDLFERTKDMKAFGFFWEQGTGKSKILVDLIRYKYMKHGIGNVLIICPKITVKSWLKQFSEHSNMDDLVEVLDGNKLEKLETLQNSDKTVFIINYDSFRDKSKLTKFLLKRKWMIKIADESHKIKATKSQRGKLVVQLKSDFSYIASGSPILKNEMDLYNQIKFLGSKIFGDNFFAFRARFFIDENESFKGKEQHWPSYVLDPDKADLFRNLLASVSDRKLKKDCLDLPSKTFQIYNVEMCKEQQEAYNNIKNELVHWIEENEEAVVAKNILTKTVRLAQITSGFMKTDKGNLIRFKVNPKLEALKELLENLDGHKVVVSCAFIADIELLGNELKEYNPAFLYGGKDTKDKFINDKSCKIIICHPHSLIGINDLVIADYMIYFSNNYSYEDRVQSQDRLHRIGQKRNCTFIDLVASEVDELILDNIQNKKNISENILNYFKNNG